MQLYDEPLSPVCLRKRKNTGDISSFLGTLEMLYTLQGASTNVTQVRVGDGVGWMNGLQTTQKLL